MIKIRINLIITAVWIAMLALLLIQISQTLQLYDRKSEDFKSKVNTALERISLRYEKMEDYRRYSSLMNKNVSSQYKDLLKEEFQNLYEVKESISIKDTVIFIRGRLENYLVVTGNSYDSISGLVSKQVVLARDVRQMKELFDGSKKRTLFQEDSIRKSYRIDQRVINKIVKKAKYINDVMVHTFQDNMYLSPQERIHIKSLDSLIHQEIKKDHLPLEYQFVVIEENNQPVAFPNAPSCYSLKVDTSQSQETVLFPNKILEDKLTLHIYFPKSNSFVLKTMGTMLIISLVLAVLIIITITYMFRTILSQKKLNEIKNDFISNMTHEFKTPISTISLACEALNDPSVIPCSQQEVAPFVKMIQEENKRLGLLVESILQSASVDRGELTMKLEKVPIIEVIQAVAKSASFRIAGEDGEFILDLPKEEIYIEADRLHFTNMVNNLIDNAIKYSKEKIHITVKLNNYSDRIEFRVIDKGIGIKREHISKIFDKLYRIPTGNVHNVKGFGLGLSYVKAIADMFRWDIHVTSQYGEGSEFRVIIKK
ncbi:MAG TPA: HAMP domain-containing sensor histidine kinase [Fluviicola sp.]|nr:HAMP domain-containing sensor histidine kinase [Fluviicola sp.]